jgi:hypothetical protein
MSRAKVAAWVSGGDVVAGTFWHSFTLKSALGQGSLVAARRLQAVGK